MNNLTQADYQKLRESFITSEIADKAQISRVDSPVGAATVGQEKNTGKEDFSGLIFPYYFPGQTNVRERRLRRDNPPQEMKNGEYKDLGKYLSPPGRGNMLYFPPGAAKEHLSDVSLPIVITEGEKKVLALHRASWHDLSDAADSPRFLPIGLTGVWNFRGVIGKTSNASGNRINVKGTISDFGLLAWADRKVYILYDANAATNDSVSKARRRLAGVLKDLKAKVFYVDCPPVEGCNGIDDVLGKIEREENEKRACRFLFKLLDDSTTSAKTSSFELRADGVYFIEKADGDSSKENAAFRVCSPLVIAAETQTERGENYGRLLEWRDSQKRPHKWAMPIEFLYSDSAELVKHLASNGLEITPSRKHREKLAFYIADSKPEKVVISTDKIGWHDQCFVLPEETVGNSENEIVYQSEYDRHHNFKTSGSLEDWQTNIARYCSKNSRLLFAVSTAFASALLPIVQMQGGGFHFRGSTSTGKTTALLVGGSVWGGDSELGFVRTWKATANGLEIIAAMHNHALLCLDEIGECDSRTVGDVAYMLANGRGKARMNKTLQAKHSLSWKLLFLSNGEQSLADKITEAGGTVRGGQEVRFCDIEADTGKFGLFEHLHDLASGQQLSDHLSSASCRFYGSPIRVFLEELTKIDALEILDKWQKFKTGFIDEVLPKKKDVSTEVLRVAARFALVAFGGEVATDKGITKWTEGEALEAARVVFAQWMNGREGFGQTDAENAVRQVRAFLEEFG
ncbi:MAG TPA: DUF927 domain-containing protein, partial [Pyrinomonadaceae bacterium]